VACRETGKEAELKTLSERTQETQRFIGLLRELSVPNVIRNRGLLMIHVAVPRRRPSGRQSLIAAFAVAGVAVSLFGGAPTAHAQYSPALAPRLRVQQEGTAAGRFRTAQTLSAFFAPFTGNDAGGVGTAFGGLLSYEIAFVPTQGKPFAFGMWYWTDADGDLFEFHGKTFFSDQWGLQAGILTSPRGFQTLGDPIVGPGGTITFTTKSTSGTLYDAFVLYNLTPPNKARNYWNFQAGAGAFIDTTGGRTTTDFTGFIQGDTSLTDKIKLMTSYWYVADRGHFNRFGLGVGYNF